MNQSIAPAVNPKPAEAAVAGHFGEIAQGLAGPGGPVALVTLPCPALVTRVRYRPAPGALASAEPVSAKALRAARATLDRFGLAGWGGEIGIARPCPPGLGAGTSTAETLGAVRAVAAAFGRRLAPEEEAALCLGAEGAIDPLMHPGMVLFASRRGEVLEWLPPLPPMTVVGGFAGPERETDPDDCLFAEAAAIFASVRQALAERDAPALGRAATRSAVANQASRPNPAFDAVRAIAARVGAHGVAVGHTGAAVALLLPAGSGTDAPAEALAAAGVRDVIAWDLG